jgi:hypothetical protein
MEELSMSESKNAPTGDPIEAAAQMLKDADKPIEATAVEVKQGEPAADDESLGEGGKKALKAEREARTNAERQAAELKAKLDKLEAANLSDLEKAQKVAQEAQEAAAKAGLEAMRYRIAAEHGITENAELILTAPDEATMRQQATLWSERAAATSTAPKPDLTQAAQSAPALNSDALTDALARAVGAR